MRSYTKNTGYEEKRNRAYNNGKKSIVYTIAFRICVICLLIFGAVALRVHFVAKTERLNKQIVRIQKKIKDINIETRNHRARREELTAWPSIKGKLSKYRLGLRETDPRQISYIKLQSVPRRKLYSGIEHEPKKDYAAIKRTH